MGCTGVVPPISTASSASRPVPLLSGYEVRGLEYIPPGPALIVFYHGALPIDHYYLLAEVLTRLNRLICTVGDKFVYKVPGEAAARRWCRCSEPQSHAVGLGCGVNDWYPPWFNLRGILAAVLLFFSLIICVG